MQQTKIVLDSSNYSINIWLSMWKSVYEQSKTLKQIIAEADVDMSLLQDAQNGNLTAAAMYKKSMKATRLNNLKN